MEETKSTFEARATRYPQLLQGEGCAVMVPDWEEETVTWMMRLRYEGVTMYFLLDAEDPSFVRLILPNLHGCSRPWVHRNPVQNPTYIMDRDSAAKDNYARVGGGIGPHQEK